jgi:hypothetical protein
MESRTRELKNCHRLAVLGVNDLNVELLLIVRGVGKRNGMVRELSKPSRSVAAAITMCR